MCVGRWFIYKNSVNYLPCTNHLLFCVKKANCMVISSQRSSTIKFIMPSGIIAIPDDLMPADTMKIPHCSFSLWIFITILMFIIYLTTVIIILFYYQTRRTTTTRSKMWRRRTKRQETALLFWWQCSHHHCKCTCNVTRNVFLFYSNKLSFI